MTGAARRLIVEATGPLSTVQDLGRPGLAHLGVTTSGAADRAALRLANRLVGNLDGAAGLEVTLGGLALHAEAPLTAAVTGAGCPVRIDGIPQPRNAVLEFPAGAQLTLGTAAEGIRCYLAVRGGIAVPPVLGSCSWDTLAALGTPPLRPGDQLAVGDSPGPWVSGWPVLEVAPVPAPAAGVVVLRALPGPWPRAWGPAALDALFATPWSASADSDRVGLRLQGDPVPAQRLQGSEVIHWPSAGLVRGAIQVPPGGRPLVFLADHPVTGGYPVLACLLDADTDTAAQLRPGQAVRLRRGGGRGDHDRAQTPDVVQVTGRQQSGNNVNADDL